MYIFQDDKLKEGTFWAAKIDHLSPATDLRGYTWIVGIKSKTVCPSFINWFVREVVFEFIDLCRRACSDPNTPLFYSFDGEVKVMNPMLESTLIPMWRERCVMMVKHAASTSALCNACDTGNIHKATKRSARVATEESALVGKEGVLAQMLAAFLKHSPSTTPKRRGMVSKMILRIVAAHQRVVTSSMIQHSFIKSGQVLPPGSIFIDFLDSKLALCSTQLTLPDSVAIREAFPSLVELARKNGKVTEDDMDKAVVPKHRPGIELTDKRVKPKDQRALHQQRTVVVNHQDVLAQLAASTAKKATSTGKKKPSSRKPTAAKKSTTQQPVAVPAVLHLVAKAVPPGSPDVPQRQAGWAYFYCARCPTSDVVMQVKESDTFVKCGACNTEQFVGE